MSGGQLQQSLVEGTERGKERTATGECCEEQGYRPSEWDRGLE